MLKLPTLKSLNSGFTLIEILVTIAIIGAMATAVVVTFPGALKSGRDVQRRSDLKQYQTSLEKNANLHSSSYPSSGGVNTITTINSAAICTTALGESVCPNDPKTSGNYKYIANSASAAGTFNATTYVIYTTLERPATTTYFVICSGGVTLCKTTGAPATATCPTTNIVTCP